jgi:hypothetical protein
MVSEGIAGVRQFFFQSRRMKLFFIWTMGIALILFTNVIGKSAEDRTVACSTFVCAGTTFLVWSYRKRISQLLNVSWSPRKKFVAVGSVGAVWVESVFWALEKGFGASGVAASSNLFLDLVITMPWYVIMLWLLYTVETRYRYSYTEILLLGGIYELGADGIFGQALEGLTVSGIVLTVMVMPLFVTVYSVMVLPPSFIVRKEIDELRRCRPPGTHKYWGGLIPLAGLLPFAFYIVLVLLIMGAV